jgi:hypothetical protein
MKGSNEKAERNSLRKQAIREAFVELMAMDERAFQEFLDEHREGDIAQALIYANAFEDDAFLAASTINFVPIVCDDMGELVSEPSFGNETTVDSSGRMLPYSVDDDEDLCLAA